ncbi:serine/threonine-protein kinase [Nocardia sp. SSK8]|uniref:serine/threonine-protein kinase n=1 Tax=Nocardia sp. SSK8 TaxID=3120154 RepID=UPI003008EA08
MTIQPPDPRDPGTIGRYRVLGTLDSAPGFHAVLAAGPDNSLVVVQQAGQELLGEPDFRVRLRHSAVAAMRVAGAHNTTVIDVDADAERPWLASVFVPGVRLDQAVAEHGPLPVPAVRALAGSLASALRAVHGAGLVHRRLRADSVLLSTDRGRLSEIGITPVEGASNTAAALGTPEFLAPEQALGLEVTPAADVFALGSVLAFAASGVTPFAAPSVPYTLFNIAQREPDLSRVPEPLFEMLAACLRKDPAARPTPGQILQYLGGEPTGPPPWPAPVLDDIGRREHEITALLAALPPMTAPEPEPARPLPERLADLRSTTVEFGRRAALFAQDRWKASSPRLRIGAALGVVAVLLALTGITAFATRERPPVTGLTLAELRRVDGCAWLTTALGDVVPVDPEPLPADTWTYEPSSTWGCRAASGRYGITLALGEENQYLTPQVNLVDGVPVIDGSNATCARAIASPGDEHEAGIVISLTEPGLKGTCAGLDYVAANIARTLTSAPRAEDRDGSLATLDPCALLDRELVADKIGALPATPTIADAHTCQWDARLRLSVKLVRASLLTAGENLEMTTVDGLQMYLDKGSSRAICTRAYLLPDSTETVEVAVHGIDGLREDYCPITTSVLRHVVDQLPNR